ncbi:glutathione S-transferase [Rhizobium sp. AG855]|nr:glutathione S-transferase [Rhizobium sp. AG855]
MAPHHPGYRKREKGMNMLKIYGRSDSSNSAKVYWLLDEIGQTYERIDCGGKFGGNDQPAYLAMNPNGKVPTVVDGDVVVWESNAILRYIASRHKAVSLWPEDAAGRAAIDMWMDWSATTLTPPLGRLRKALKAGEEFATAPVFAAFQLLDTHLEGSRYIAGNQFSIADIAAGANIHRWTLLSLEKPELKNIAAYHHRLLERPAFVSRIAQSLS